MADAEPRGSARKAAVGQQGAGLAQALALEERRRVQHFLHAGSALGALVHDHHHVAGLDPVGQNGLARDLL